MGCSVSITGMLCQKLLFVVRILLKGKINTSTKKHLAQGELHVSYSTVITLYDSVIL